MGDVDIIIKNYPYISKIFTPEWFEDELKKDKEEMHLLANQFTFKDKDESSLDISSLQYIGYLEMFLKNLEYEINSKKMHFIDGLKDNYHSTLAEIEIGYLFKNMGFELEFEPPIPDTKNTGDIKFVSDEGLEVFVEVFTRTGPPTEEIYIFSWDDILRNDYYRLIHYLEHIYNVDLDEKRDIDKIDDSTIKISAGKKIILLKLNDEKNRVTLKIDNVIIDEFIAKLGRENDELNDKRNVFYNPTRIRAIKFRSPSDFRDKIEGEINQLSKSNPGIVALYLKPGSTPEYRNIIKGFCNNVWDNDGNIIGIVDFSIVSAFLIYIRSFNGKESVIFKKLCLNPVANHLLPKSIIQKFEESEIIRLQSCDVSFSNPHRSE